MLDRILQFIAEYFTTKTTALSASNWTAGKADFVSGTLAKWGATRVLFMTIRTNAAIADGEEATLGTLVIDSTNNMVNGVGTGIGIVSALNNGIMRQYTLKPLNANTNIYVRFWWRV